MMRYGVLFLLLMAMRPTAQATPQHFVFNMGFDHESVQADLQTQPGREVCMRIGTSIEFIRVPAERALQNVNEGVEDGNLIRIAGLEALYPNLISIPEKAIDYDFVAFTKGKGFTIKDWNSLQNRDVGIVTAWEILESNIRGTRSTIKAKNGEPLFQLLAKDRIKITVYQRLQGLVLKRQMDCASAKVLELPLARSAMFINLNKRHTDLIEPAARSLRAIKADGSYARIYQDVFGIRPPEEH